jgi:membrane-bound lytic murein transglycosylase D
VIESSLDAGVVSWAGAVGPWQIMPEEAKRLGLKLSPVDERTDYEKSTQAAATILRESFAEFGDWLLVVAAYNGGAGRVRQAMKKKGSKDFWEIQYELPLETRNHVKKFIATQYVFETANIPSLNKKEGIIKMTKEQKQGLDKQFDAIVISGRYSIESIATILVIDLNKLRQDNPGMNKILATGATYELKLPKGMLEKFEARKNEILQASFNALYQLD